MKDLHHLYLKDNIISDCAPYKSPFLSIITAALSLFFFFSCSSFNSQQKPQTTGLSSTPSNLFNLPNQIVNNDLVRSIQLHKSNNQRSIPAIELGTTEKLNLTFDMLEFSSRQFSVTFTHHNKDWNQSSLAPDFYIDGLQRLYLDGGQPISNNRPVYRHYSYTFPDDQFNFTKSGNYMLRVEDTDTGFLLFSIPFFVYENEGQIISSVEALFPRNDNLRIRHRPVSRYNLPEWAEQPQFNLEFIYTQNRFWGRPKQADELDFSDSETVRFELSENQSFIGDYEFMLLNLEPLSQANPQIVEYNPAEIPPEVVLIDNYRGFTAATNPSVYTRFGLPDNSPATPYANVLFSFSSGNTDLNDADIYLVGDVTNWAIKSNNKMEFDEETGRWQTSRILKKGLYTFKYILLEDGTINDLYFDDRFAQTRQEYHTFVYLRDRGEFYDRLLQYNEFYSGN